MIHKSLGAALGICFLLGVSALAQTPAEPPFDSTKDDEALLAKVGLKSEGTALLDYFRKRTFAEADPRKVDQLLLNLGHEDYHIREKAHQDLLTLGGGAMVGLKQVENSLDAEVRRRALALRTHIEAKAEAPVQGAVARLIGKRKPAGSAEVLLAYIPFAADQGVVDDICRTLGNVALEKGQADPVLVKALEDKLPLKRGAAAEALIRAGAKEQLSTLRTLLKDTDPIVRLRTGVALAYQKDSEALPVLIETMKHLNPDQLWPVEEVLVKLAGDKTPSVSLGTTAASRTETFDAWSKWLAGQKNVEWSRLTEKEAMLNYTLVVQHTNRVVGVRRFGAGEVYELDQNKKVRWKFEVQTYPVDAQVTGVDRVLVAEYQAARVTERDLKGNVVWERAVGGNPIGVQRLPNGNTFVILQNRLVELKKNGEEVFVLQRPNHDIFRAKKLPNGDTVYLTNSGLFTRVDRNQKVVKSFQAIQVPVLFGSIDLLPNGGLLIPDFQNNRVVEFDSNGKQVHTFNFQWPNSVMRLPNGNTLVSSQNTRKVAEFDRNNREVWSYTNTDGMIFNARKR